MLVEVDPDKHAENTENIHLDAEAQSQFHQHEVDGKGGADAWSKVGRENALNGALGGHNVKNFPENSTKQPTDEHENE